MADAALPVLRAILELPAPQQVRAEPLAPLQMPPASRSRAPFRKPRIGFRKLVPKQYAIAA